MNADLHKKLLQDLQKSGFATEMQTIRAVRNAGWNSSGSGIYFDRDQSMTRAIDITAFKSMNNSRVGTGGLHFEYHLFIEVKKTERPWIVFRHSEPANAYGDTLDNPYVSHSECMPLADLTPFLHEHSIRTKLGWVGYGVHEAFKAPQDAGRWYTAAVTTCKAAYDYVRREAFMFLKKSGSGTTYLILTHPIIVIDGSCLISAKLVGEEEPNLEEIPFAPLQFGFSTARYESGTYRVDLVALKSITDYFEYSRWANGGCFWRAVRRKTIAKATPPQ
ncbi:MAG: hypothetical protein DLM73_00555 [Chthoniobacterales bacterium]|nr:MAG: hypothetical protein DLM73_00555 [Chthoniobacterales bacterium]